MAIASSKLGGFVSRWWESDDLLLRRLREHGLLLAGSEDAEVMATFVAARNEDSSLDEAQRAFNSPSERVRVFLAPYLTEKGAAWAEPLSSLDLPDEWPPPGASS